MEVEETLNNGINPKNMTGPETFVIRLNPETNDTVLQEERIAKAGGTFKQFKIFLYDKDKEERELRFLFGKHLNPLIREFGGNTETWVNNKVEVIPKQQGDFFDVELKPAGLEVKEEKV